MTKGKMAYYPGSMKKEKKVIEKYGKCLRKKKVLKKNCQNSGPSWMEWPVKITIG